MLASYRSWGGAGAGQPGLPRLEVSAVRMSRRRSRRSLPHQFAPHCVRGNRHADFARRSLGLPPPPNPIPTASLQGYHPRFTAEYVERTVGPEAFCVGENFVDLRWCVHVCQLCVWFGV